MRALGACDDGAVPSSPTISECGIEVVHKFRELVYAGASPVILTI